MIGLYKKHTALSQLLIAVVIILGTVLVLVVPQIRSASKVNNDDSSQTSSLDGQIFTLEESIKSNPNNIKSYVSLSQAYLQKARETADAAYYQKINELMDKAEKIEPDNYQIPATRALVEIGRHHFKEGKLLADKAILLNPNNYLNYGILGDALVELGQYKEAVAAFQKMTDIRPGYSAYVRIAYIRELYGDTEGGKEFLKQAIEEGSSYKENIAFAYVELGKLDMRTDLNEAEKDFNAALRTVEDYPPALEGLGKIAYFRKDTKLALEYFTKAYNKLPIVQYAVDLGDVATAEGDIVNAKQYYTLAELAFEKSAKSGVNTDLEESLFLSDNNLKLPQALTMAESAYRERPSVYAADYLSWALYKNGKYREAAKYKGEALRLGENDPLILFHQGLIANKNGDPITAKRLLTKSSMINPYFSITQSMELKKELQNIK